VNCVNAADVVQSCDDGIYASTIETDFAKSFFLESLQRLQYPLASAVSVQAFPL
jgi:hypothetical protein